MKTETLAKEPTDKVRCWDIVGEDELGLSSRYLTNFILFDANHRPCTWDVLQKSTRQSRLYAIGDLVREKDRLRVKIGPIVDWNIELGVKPSSGVWLATSKAWYKLMRPMSEYRSIYAPLEVRANLCIVTAAIINTNGDGIHLDQMKDILAQFKVPPTALEAHAEFVWDVLGQKYSDKSVFMQELRDLGLAKHMSA